MPKRTAHASVQDRTEADPSPVVEPPPRTWVQIRTLRALLLAAEHFRDAHKELFVEDGLSITEFDVIAALGNTQGLRMKDIAARLMASSSTSNVTRLCISLESRGLLERKRAVDNDREVIASLTTKGEQLFAELFPKVTRFTRDYANARLPPEDLETLYGLLVRLNEK
jgi:DNA-binding MarR family transcriptional regulator